MHNASSCLKKSLICYRIKHSAGQSDQLQLVPAARTLMDTSSTSLDPNNTTQFAALTSSLADQSISSSSSSAAAVTSFLQNNINALQGALAANTSSHVGTLLNFSKGMGQVRSLEIMKR
jgi:hypothetical protein